ncbi:hypothetical protein LX69_02711 [Breznakibacter xylanolyticus]|uniref:Uncharacterized protein n=1 Tax=Breznakibacter xylanolyticus TaxID=990 RepID=A0A2W7MZE1_9BACT|nr:hypothetical protein [Breznakibacter xylanolyticus]PZX13051.1 hypothetical protein LX69_02711 [Breznakibacter xylanolyticus]
MKTSHSFTFRIVLCIASMTISLPAMAKKVPATVVTTSSDTLLGEIRLSKVNIADGSFLLGGYDPESFHYMVAFRQHGKKRFKSFGPEELKAFSFVIDSVPHLYRSFVIDRKSIVPSEQNSVRFLHCLYDGTISLYFLRSTYPVNRQPMSGLLRFDEYFLHSATAGLVIIKDSDRDLFSKERLIQMGMDDEFIKQLSGTPSFKNILSILTTYDQWLKPKK